MIHLDLDSMDDVRGGAAHAPAYHAGWTEQTKHARGQLYYREVSPKGRPGRWQIVDTYFANDP